MPTSKTQPNPQDASSLSSNAKLKQSCIAFRPIDKHTITPTLVKSLGNDANKTETSQPPGSSTASTSKMTKTVKTTAVKRKSTAAIDTLKNSKLKEKSKKKKHKHHHHHKKESSTSSKQTKASSSKKKKETIVLSDEDDDDDVPLSVLKSKIVPTLQKSKQQQQKASLSTGTTPAKVVVVPTSPKVILKNYKLQQVNRASSLNLSPKTVVNSLPLSQVKLSASSIQSLLPNLKIGSPIKQSVTPSQLTSVQVRLLVLVVLN